MSEADDSARSQRRSEVRYGGSIEQTLAGNAELEVMAVIREAWARTDGIKGIVVVGMLLIYAALVLATVVLGTIFGFGDQGMMADTISQLVVVVIVYPFMAGVFMLGLRHSVGLPVSFQEQFTYYNCLMPIAAVGLLQGVVTSLGFLLLILPGIYLTIALCLAVPLKAERNLPITECLVTSLRLVNSKFTEVAVLTIVALALMVLGLVSLIGWIWTLPWTLMIFSIIYRQLVGFQPAEASGRVAF